jgi:hypothetical protein
MAVNAAMVGLILRLNARFYEASVSSSARLYERIRRKRQGVPTFAKPRNARIQLPMVPWWGGAGPNIWRQFTTLVRTPTKLIGVASLLILPPMMMVLTIPRKSSGPPVAIAGLSMMLSMAMIAPSMIGFDFRTDLDRMEMLKTLPLKPFRLAIGQILTPASLISGTEWVALLLLTFASPELWAWLLGLGLLLLPLNLLLVTIENSYFLWFPFRMNASNSVDFQGIGRQLLLFTAKFLSATVAVGLAAALGALCHVLSGRSWLAAFVGAWVGLTFCALATVPIVAQAFTKFDVANIPAE